jgi:hypothetical protein
MVASREVQEAMDQGNPAAKVDAMELFLSTMTSVKKFAADF